MKKKIISMLLAVIVTIGMITIAKAADSERVSFSGHTYQRFDLSMTWSEAKDYCESLGGYLVTITSEQEQNFILGLVSKGEGWAYWIGANDIEQEGSWKWVTGEPFNYTNWAPGEPNDHEGREDYGLIFTDGSWNDGKIDDPFGFICEWGDPVQALPPVTPDIITTVVGVKLTWDVSDPSQGYYIYRAKPGEKAIKLNDTPVFGGEFMDVNVDSNTTYYYMIVPADESGQSAPPSIQEEQPAEATAEVTTETIVEPENTSEDSKKNFILMKIGKDTMLVNESTVEIDPGRGTTPVVQNGRTLVPIRAIIEAMGGTIGWDEAERKVSLSANGHNIEMWLDQKEIIADGNRLEIDVPPTTINDRTMLPIRFVAENAGCAIEWIGSTEEVVIVF